MITNMANSTIHKEKICNENTSECSKWLKYRTIIFLPSIFYTTQPLHCLLIAGSSNGRRGGTGLGKGPQTHPSGSRPLLRSRGPQGQAPSCQSVEKGALQSGELVSRVLGKARHKEAQRDMCRKAGSELRFLQGPGKASSPSSWF